MTREKLIEIAKELWRENEITDFDYLKCQIIIDYLFTDTSYDELVNKYYVSRATVRRAINEKAPEYFGSEIVPLLRAKGKSNRDKSDKTRKYDIYKVADINLYGIEKILNEEIIELSKKDLLMLEAAYLFLLGNTYNKISEKLDISIATISVYLNSQRIEELLNKDFFKRLKNRLLSSASVSSKRLTKKNNMTKKSI